MQRWGYSLYHHNLETAVKQTWIDRGGIVVKVTSITVKCYAYTYLGMLAQSVSLNASSMFETHSQSTLDFQIGAWLCSSRAH